MTESIVSTSDGALSLTGVLDLDTWSGQEDIQLVYDRLEKEVAGAVAQEERIRKAIRSEIFPQIPAAKNAPPLAGVWSLTDDDIRTAQEKTLFAGDVEAATGTSFVLDSMQLTVIQVGVCLLRYRGDERTWEHRLFFRDVAGHLDPMVEALALLAQRGHEDDRALHQPDRLTTLGTRGLTAFAERAVLARVATAPWRMGIGSPAPFEILSGAGAVDLVREGLAVLRELICEHRRFVFVQRTPRKRQLLTVGLALEPGEFAVIHHLQTYIQDMVDHGHLRGERREDALDFVRTVGREVVVGVFRTSRMASPYVFYAPADEGLCAQAATLAMADAALQDHKGFPLLLDLADRIGGDALGQGSLRAATEAAFHAHGHAPTTER